MSDMKLILEIFHLCYVSIPDLDSSNYVAYDGLTQSERFVAWFILWKHTHTHTSQPDEQNSSSSSSAVSTVHEETCMEFLAKQESPELWRWDERSFLHAFLLLWCTGRVHILVWARRREQNEQERCVENVAHTSSSSPTHTTKSALGIKSLII